MSILHVCKFQQHIYVLAGILMLTSCSFQKENDYKISSLLGSQLANSSELIKQTTSFYREHLESKTLDPHMSEKAVFWKKRSIQVQKLSLIIYNHISIQKLRAASKEGFTRKDELYDEMDNYVKGISNIDSSMTEAFKPEINNISKIQDDPITSKERFIDGFPPDASPELSIGLLNKFENAVAIVENRMTQYCDNHVGSTSDGFSIMHPLVSQNTTHLKTNEQLEINVVVACLHISCNPQVYIDGKNIPVNEQGIYNYKIQVLGKTGSYFIPVKMEYYDFNSKKITINKTVQYFID